MKTPRIDAVIFDLDGVITNSTPLHSQAWKEMFDSFLKKQSTETNTPFREFTHNEDYLAYVDGKPRYSGVQSFLESRGIYLPFGNPDQEPSYETICGLGNKKNEIYNQLLSEKGVEIYATSVEFIHELKDAGIPLGLATSSKNAERVLELTGLLDLFQTRVDGLVSAELGLEGKPSPDIFQTACDNLGADYERSVIIEDANSGVQAGYRGHFGLVLGVAREGNEEELELHGADLVVEDLLDISIKDIRNWFQEGKQKKGWTIEYFRYDPDQEGTRESLCSIGNGYFASRGAMEEIPANLDINYPGTYITGLYNRLESQISGKTISNEDFVNCPNWLPITYRIDNGDWFDPNQEKILEFHRKLDFKNGILTKTMVVRDQDGNQTRIQSSRLISMADPYLAGLKYSITPLNYTGVFTIRTELDGTITNQGVKRYRDLSSRHIDPQYEGGEDSISYLSVTTNQSKITIGVAAKLIVTLGDIEINPQFTINTNQGKVTTTFEVEARSDSPICIEKLTAYYSSNVPDVDDPLQSAQEKVRKIQGYQQIETESTIAWRNIWDKIDLRISGDRLVQKMIRLHLYHSMVSVSSHSAALDAGIPARGLTGEAYRGHIFWDELFIMPFYILQFPETARSAILYRYRRLGAASNAAIQDGFQGAQFPWQSGSSGREETQSLHLNPISGKWGADFSHLQRHVSLAIAYNLWNYFWITSDDEFLIQFGAELLLSICQYWAGRAVFDPVTERYHISGIMGPDEFHESLPGSDQPGLTDNSYTNLMVVWTIKQAFNAIDLLPKKEKGRILAALEISSEDLDIWRKISNSLNIPLSEEGILEQFQGYFNLKELDWEHYQKTYPDIHRMDRILKSEGLSPNDFKVAKQADALMVFYNLKERTIQSILEELGYEPPDDLLQDNLHYYLQRTSHGSTLSRLVHAYLAFLTGNNELSWKLYQESLRSDYQDIQGGTTREGIHLGVMTGTVLFALRAYAGLDWTENQISIKPALPQGWKEMEFNITYRGDRYFFKLSNLQVNVKLEAKAQRKVMIQGKMIEIKPGDWIEYDLT
jgi:beta-phosphoglucomutase family hydrolase